VLTELDYYPISSVLEENGWLTPNTYGPYFSKFPRLPGVYLFLFSELNRLKESFPSEQVLYVGMSIDIKRRQNGHEVYRQIFEDLFPTYGNFFHCARYFKIIDRDNLRKEEASLIKKYNPPYNLIHRQKGVLVNG